MRKPPAFRALTLKGAGLLRELRTPCQISAAFNPATTPVAQQPALGGFDAIWDTGAMASVVSGRVKQVCNLQPIGMVIVHGVHGAQQTSSR